MPLGLGNNLSRTGMVTPGIITDNLVLKHNYSAGSVVPISDGAAYLNESNADYITMGDVSNFSDADGSDAEKKELSNLKTKHADSIKKRADKMNKTPQRGG